MQYFRHSTYPNSEYRINEQSYSYIDDNGTLHPYNFEETRHLQLTDTILPKAARKDKENKFTATVSKPGQQGNYVHKIYEEYKTEEAYMDAINRVVVMRELIT